MPTVCNKYNFVLRIHILCTLKRSCFTSLTCLTFPFFCPVSIPFPQISRSIYPLHVNTLTLFASPTNTVKRKRENFLFFSPQCHSFFPLFFLISTSFSCTYARMIYILAHSLSLGFCSHQCKRTRTKKRK